MMMTVTAVLPRLRPAHASAWPVVTVDRLDRTSVRALLDNEIAAIRRLDFLDDDTCRLSTARLLASKSWGYYEGVEPRQGRLGITQYEHHGDRDSYFAAAPTATTARQRALGELPDPLMLLQHELGAVWDEPVAVACEESGTYFAGVFRLGSGARYHADWGPRDGPDWAIGGVQAQIAWNVYYAVPTVGGELVLFDRPWSPDLEEHARQRYNDYDPRTLLGHERVDIQVRRGELVMFSSTNVHGVTEAPNGGDRLSLGSFIGERNDGSLILWS
jgi:2OG-Fe(II) oxygenase superfamily